MFKISIINEYTFLKQLIEAIIKFYNHLGLKSMWIVNWNKTNQIFSTCSLNLL